MISFFINQLKDRESLGIRGHVSPGQANRRLRDTAWGLWCAGVTSAILREVPCPPDPLQPHRGLNDPQSSLIRKEKRKARFIRFKQLALPQTSGLSQSGGLGPPFCPTAVLMNCAGCVALHSS